MDSPCVNAAERSTLSTICSPINRECPNEKDWFECPLKGAYTRCALCDARRSSLNGAEISALCGNKVLLKCEKYDVCIVLEIELLHDVILVKRDCFLAHVQDSGDFFHGAPFSE